MVTLKLVLISWLQRRKKLNFFWKKKDKILRLNFSQESSRCTSTRKYIFKVFHLLDNWQNIDLNLKCSLFLSGRWNFMSMFVPGCVHLWLLHLLPVFQLWWVVLCWRFALQWKLHTFDRLFYFDCMRTHIKTTWQLWKSTSTAESIACFVVTSRVCTFLKHFSRHCFLVQ